MQAVLARVGAGVVGDEQGVGARGRERVGGDLGQAVVPLAVELHARGREQAQLHLGRRDDLGQAQQQDVAGGPGQGEDVPLGDHAERARERGAGRDRGGADGTVEALQVEVVAADSGAGVVEHHERVLAGVGQGDGDGVHHRAVLGAVEERAGVVVQAQLRREGAGQFTNPHEDHVTGGRGEPMALALRALGDRAGLRLAVADRDRARRVAQLLEVKRVAAAVVVPVVRDTDGVRARYGQRSVGDLRRAVAPGGLEHRGVRVNQRHPRLEGGGELGEPDQDDVTGDAVERVLVHLAGSREIGHLSVTVVDRRMRGRAGRNRRDQESGREECREQRPSRRTTRAGVGKHHGVCLRVAVKRQISNGRRSTVPRDTVRMRGRTRRAASPAFRRGLESHSAVRRSRER